MLPQHSTRKGRGATTNPANRFEAVRAEPDLEHLENSDEALAEPSKLTTEYLPDNSQSIVSENDSPDIGFRYSLNPYRGCSHGCSYCYARPTHEYLGFSAGLDFESKIMVKHDAANLFRAFLSRRKWKPETIVLSGVTDCYQPAEREFRVTRQCLEVALEARQPIDVITKNALILRDLDLLREMARLNLVRVGVSVTTLDQQLARVMEPRTSVPAARLAAIRSLAGAGVPVKVMVAPIIPGLNDVEIPAVLSAAAEAGATSASYVLLRLPLAVAPIFMAWLDEHRPDSRQKIENAIRATRGGALNKAAFGERMRGTGLLAEQIKQLFQTFAERAGLARSLPATSIDHFRPPTARGGQKKLF
ncbi:MAG TPA: PA0069 family radical SAM protein [Pirellulales bacterium]|jgi:DNA repair photolyase